MADLRAATYFAEKKDLPPQTNLVNRVWGALSGPSYLRLLLLAAAASAFAAHGDAERVAAAAQVSSPLGLALS